MSKNKYDTDAEETREQAEALLKDYYKTAKASGDKLPDRPVLLSWKLGEDGILIVIDGATGRKLEFVTDQEARDKQQAIRQAEDAEKAALDAEAQADAAEAAANAAEAAAKEARKKANKTPFAYVDKAAKDEAKSKK